MKGVAAAGVVVAAILIGAAAGYFAGGSNLQSRTTTSTTTNTITTTSSITTMVTVTSFYPDLGSHLQLRIEMNASEIRSEGAIRAQVVLANPLGSNLTAVVPESGSSTVTNWSWYDYICGGGSLDSVVSFALFKGNYVAENLSLAGEPLTLAPPLLPPCALYPTPLFMVYLPSDSIAWASLSNPQIPSFRLHTVLNATTEICSLNNSGGSMCGPSSGLFGYWQGPVSGNMENYTTSSPDFHYFSPGLYTLAAVDAWGHQAFAYFEVNWTRGAFLEANGYELSPEASEAYEFLIGIASGKVSEVEASPTPPKSLGCSQE